MPELKSLSPESLLHISQTIDGPLRGLVSGIELLHGGGTVPFIPSQVSFGDSGKNPYPTHPFDTLAEEESLTPGEVTARLRTSDVEKVTKRFYERFKAERTHVLKFIEGIPDGFFEFIRLRVPTLRNRHSRLADPSTKASAGSNQQRFQKALSVR